MLPHLMIGLLAFLVLVFLVEIDYFGTATLCLIGAVYGAHYFHVFDLLTYVRENALQAGLYAGGYVLVGIVWSFVKWFSFLMAFRDDYRDGREDYVNSYVANRQGTKEEAEKSYNSRFSRPKAMDHKSRITSWAGFWPFSLVGTFLNDPVRRLFSAVFNRIKNQYQKLADWVFRNDPELR